MRCAKRRSGSVMQCGNTLELTPECVERHIAHRKGILGGLKIKAHEFEHKSCIQPFPTSTMEATKSALTSTGKAMKNMGESIKYKLTGQKYHDSLMGEGLQDVLRKATAKTLEVPDAEFNKQVRYDV